jgi:hypothetical protein
VSAAVGLQGGKFLLLFFKIKKVFSLLSDLICLIGKFR